MDEYKKRLRLLAERLGGEIAYAYDGGLIIRFIAGSIDFTPDSKIDMTCKITTPTETFCFITPKVFAFDILHKFVTNPSLNSYTPKGLPLTVQDYIDEENTASTVSELQTRIAAGTVTNGELGGNHYDAEYYNGILILIDVFTGAPTNVVDFSPNKIEG